MRSLVIVFVLSCASLNLWALPAEQRCTELGDNCACSEPMSTSEASAAIVNGYNFVETPAAKECSKFRPYIGSDGSHRMVPVSNWGTATFALEHNKSGYIWLNAKATFSSAEKSMCYRYYKQVDNNYSSSGSSAAGANGICQAIGCSLNSGFYNCRNKVFQATFNSLSIQFQENADGDCRPAGSHHNISISVPGGTAEGNYQLTPTVTFNDCKAKPCRFEFCVDGNLSAGTNLQFRARVTSLDNGKVGVATSPVMNLGPPNIPDFWGGDLFHSGPLGNSKVGFFLQTVWNADADQWPGPACEIEGGCGVLKPPLSAPSRPQKIIGP